MEVKICEIYNSIQGESAWQGLPCLFIRVSGCNLRCVWCDSKYTWNEDESTEMTVNELYNVAKLFDARLVEITGGEPLLYSREVVRLTERLVKEGKQVLIETNGSLPIPNIHNFRNRIHFIMDIKCPSSGMSDKNRLRNLRKLTRYDNLKFVIASREDYEYAKKILKSNHIDCEVIFMPVWRVLSLETLADWILNDNLNVRLQTQLHKIIWSENVRGV